MTIRITEDSGWQEVTGRSPFATLVADARVADLEAQLQKALDELDLVTQERDMALLERDEWRKRYYAAEQGR